MAKQVFVIFRGVSKALWFTFNFQRRSCAAFCVCELIVCWLTTDLGHACIHIRIRIHHTHTYITCHTHIHAYAYIHAHSDLYIHSCMHTHTHTCIRMYTIVCMHTRAHTVCIQTHNIDPHTPNRKRSYSSIDSGSGL